MTAFIPPLLQFTNDPRDSCLEQLRLVEVLLDEELPAASEAQSSAAALAEGEKTAFLPLLMLLSA